MCRKEQLWRYAMRAPSECILILYSCSKDYKDIDLLYIIYAYMCVLYDEQHTLTEEFSLNSDVRLNRIPWICCISHRFHTPGFNLSQVWVQVWVKFIPGLGSITVFHTHLGSSWGYRMRRTNRYAFSKAFSYIKCHHIPRPCQERMVSERPLRIYQLRQWKERCLVNTISHDRFIRR